MRLRYSSLHSLPPARWGGRAGLWSPHAVELFELPQAPAEWIKGLPHLCLAVRGSLFSCLNFFCLLLVIKKLRLFFKRAILGSQQSWMEGTEIFLQSPQPPCWSLHTQSSLWSTSPTRVDICYHIWTCSDIVITQSPWFTLWCSPDGTHSMGLDKCDDMHPLLWHHAEYFTALKILCVLVVSDVSNSFQPHGLYSPPSSSNHGILQARLLDWVAIPFSKGSS